MSRVTDARYICQNAANAIISEIGPYQVSNDALQAINQFLDEFLIYLLSSSLSLDLSRIKAVVFSLLPSTLGKNAIVEAELEVKTFTETEAIDYESYEKMRTLGSNGPFPLNDTLPLLREKCLEFCTLADREDTNSVMGNNHYSNLDISIAPIVAIYVTTVLEHIAEYVLTAIAMTAEHEDVEYIRIKEVFLALIDDVQVGGVFYRMELREKLERRAFAYGYRPRTSTYAPSFHQPSKQHLRNSTAGSQHNGSSDGAGGAGGILDITFDDDLDLGYDDDESNDHPTSSISANKSNTGMNRGDHLSMSAYSMKSNFSQPRPTSMMSSSTSNGTISTLDSGFNNHNINKKSFKVFKKEGAIPPTADSKSTTPVSVYDPDAPTMNFEDLIRSGNTMRVSLTPNRLRSIEVKDQTVDEPQPTIAWERRSTSSMSRTRGSAPSSRSASPAPGPRKRSDSIHRQQPPVPKVPSHHPTSLSSINSGSRPSSPSSSPTIKKKESLLDDALHGNDHRQKSPLGPRPSTPPIPKPTVATTLVEPKIRQQQQTPPQKTNNKPVISTSPSLHSRFENPRDAPEPPKSKESLPTTTPVVTTSPPTVPQHTTTITASAPEKKKQSSNSVTVAAAAVAATPSPVTTTTAPEKVENSVTPAVITPKKEEQKQPQRPQIMRRSSMSNRKSRENLRRQREIEEQALAQAATTKLPKQEATAVSSIKSTTSSSSSVVSVKSSKESVQENSILPSPPASEYASATSKDSIKECDEQKANIAEVDDSDEDEKKVVHFVTTHHKNNQKEQEERVVDSPTEMTPQEEEKKQNELERPSTIVAQRASMAGSTRRQSLHESYAVGEKLDTVRQRLSTAGSVEMSVKGWETIMKNGDDVITPAAQRRRTMMASTPSSSSQTKQESDEEQEQRQDSSSSEGGMGEEDEGKESTAVSKGPQSRDPPLAARQTRPVSSVLDKVMKFEQNSLDDFAQQHHRQHRASAYIPRRERFLYLQREPGVLERRINPAFASKPRPIPVDAEVQTDPLPEPIIKPSSDSNNSGNAPPALVITTEDERGMTTHKELDMESGSEHGMVDGDEEWFLPDDEWEDTQEQETAVVEWLLGEA
ncbi:hypothetical protein INT45_000431 [Circinella minor]|uniref:Uncharacterized protein n=1 Tax=Circinella minor TaxID=1195481 RepID=A0A8H7RWZ3_9FUNG|nr:hypothetical protein INT45_000431 [Circinella minor]